MFGAVVTSGAAWTALVPSLLAGGLTALVLAAVDAGPAADVATAVAVMALTAAGVAVTARRTRRRVAAAQQAYRALAALAGTEQVVDGLGPEPAPARRWGRRRARTRHVVLTADREGIAVVPVGEQPGERVPYASIWGLEARRVATGPRSAALLVLTDHAGCQHHVRLDSWGQGDLVEPFLAVVRSHAQVARSSSPAWPRWTGETRRA